MTKKKITEFSNDLINNYKADPKDVAELVENFNDMRGTWSELFTLMGSRLTPSALEDFQKVIPKQINDVLDLSLIHISEPTRPY